VGSTVQRVVYQDGTSCSDPNVDPIVGISVNPADSRVEGKLVDLDPEQQMVSQVWGMRVLLGSSGQPIQIATDFEPSAFADLWPRYPQGQPDSYFGALFQGLLEMKACCQSTLETACPRSLPAVRLPTFKNCALRCCRRARIPCCWT
jgi:hypothetical protein